MRRFIIFLPVILFLISSCFKEDELVMPHEPGSILTGEAAMGNYYENSVFFDLVSDSAVKSNTYVIWDLAFECIDSGWNIYLNSAKMMYAGNTLDTVFSNIPTQNGQDMFFDKSDGNPDSTAIGKWYGTQGDTLFSYKYVYVIDRGYNESGNSIGFKKVTFNFENGDYRIRFANLDGSGEKTFLMEKDPAYSKVYLSFENGKIDFAPEKDKWSILFTRYTTMLFTIDGEAYPYLVAGVLVNPENVSAVLDTSLTFENIQLSDTALFSFSQNLDVIGHEWKYYNFTEGIYSIEPGRNYLIRNYDGLYYKLRFISFYNDQGEKGFPVFEFGAL